MNQWSEFWTNFSTWPIFSLLYIFLLNATFSSRSTFSYAIQINWPGKRTKNIKRVWWKLYYIHHKSRFSFWYWNWPIGGYQWKNHPVYNMFREKIEFIECTDSVLCCNISSLFSSSVKLFALNHMMMIEMMMKRLFKKH